MQIAPLVIDIFGGFPAGHGRHRSVLHHDGAQEVHRVQFQGGGVQQTRPWRLHRGRGGPNAI